MNNDPLILAAERLGVPVNASAGPDDADMQIWAHWPRDRLEIAHDTLERVMQLDDAARTWRSMARPASGARVAARGPSRARSRKPLPWSPFTSRRMNGTRCRSRTMADGLAASAGCLRL